MKKLAQYCPLQQIQRELTLLSPFIKFIQCSLLMAQHLDPSISAVMLTIMPRKTAFAVYKLLFNCAVRLAVISICLRLVASLKYEIQFAGFQSDFNCGNKEITPQCNSGCKLQTDGVIDGRRLYVTMVLFVSLAEGTFC